MWYQRLTQWPAGDVPLAGAGVSDSLASQARAASVPLTPFPALGT